MTSYRPMPLGPATAGQGALTAVARVIEVDYDNWVATVVDQHGATKTISMRIQVGKSTSFPRIGEDWLISQEYGNWTFIAAINATPSVFYPRWVTSDTIARPSEYLAVDATGGAVIISVPTTAGFCLYVKKVDSTSHAVIIRPIPDAVFNDPTADPVVNISVKAGMYINQVPPFVPGSYGNYSAVALTVPLDIKFVMGMGGYLL